MKGRIESLSNLCIKTLRCLCMCVRACVKYVTMRCGKRDEDSHTGRKPFSTSRTCAEVAVCSCFTIHCTVWIYSLWNVCDCTSSMLGEGQTLRYVTRAQLTIPLCLSLLFSLRWSTLAPACNECRYEKWSGVRRLVVGRWVQTFQKYLLPPSSWLKIEATGSS